MDARPRRARLRSWLVAWTQVVALTASGLASAQQRVDPETQKHFDIANGLYGEQRYADALVEYDAAYERSHNFRILYNRGNCLVMLKREPEAIETFERYLSDGGTNIPEDRRAKVRADIDSLKLRLGTIVLEGAPDGAEVVLDGHVVGRTPLSSFVASAGAHELSIRWSAAQPLWASEINVVAGGRAVAKVSVGPAASTPASPVEPTQPPGGFAAQPGAPSGPAVVGPPPRKRAPHPPGGLYAPAIAISAQAGVGLGGNDFGVGTLGTMGTGELAVAFRLSSFLDVGAYFGLARGSFELASPPNGVQANAGYGFRTYGLRGRMHLVQGESYDGWLGVDLGRFDESWSLKGTDGREAFGLGASSFAYGLSIGLDIPLGRALALGGAVRYLAASADDPSVSGTCTLSDCAGAVFSQGHNPTRGFFELGLRVVWSIPVGAPARPTAPSPAPPPASPPTSLPASAVAALPGPSTF
jgi:hypothetical protein